MNIEELKNDFGFVFFGSNKEHVYYYNLKGEFNSCRNQRGWVYEFSKENRFKETQKFLITRDNVIEIIRKYRIDTLVR